MGAALEIYAPSHLGIEADRRDITFEFLAEIRACIEEQIEVQIDLSRCEEISRSACILLAAELENCARRCKSVRGKLPKHSSALLSLDAFGIYEHLGIQSPIDRRFSKKIRRNVILIKAGHDGEGEYLEKLSDIKKAARSLYGDSLFADDVLVALDEAIININRHAYLGKNTGEESRLWLAGIVDAKEKALLVYALDHGFGIPNKAPTTMAAALNEYWLHAPPNTPELPSDAEILRAAILATRTGVGLNGRGQGLPTMVDLVREKSIGGAMNIVSGAGGFKLVKNGPDPLSTEEGSFHLSRSFHGTLIVWRIEAPIER